MRTNFIYNPGPDGDESVAYGPSDNSQYCTKAYMGLFIPAEWMVYVVDVIISTHCSHNIQALCTLHVRCLAAACRQS